MCRFIASLLVIFSFTFAVVAASAAPAPAVSAAAAGPARPPLIVRTSDGLPMEVALVSVHRGAVRVRNLASNREIPLLFAKLDVRTRKVIEDEIMNVRKNVRGGFKFGAVVESNPSNLKPFTAISRKASLQVGEQSTNSRIVPPGGYCVRLSNVSLAKAPPTVDLPVELHLFWYKSAGRTGWESSSPEKVNLTISDLPGEYLSHPVKFESNAYKGFVAIIINPANGAILWKRADGTFATEFLKDAEKRLGTTTLPPTP
ncbi:MAG: hypothetical protein LBS59_07345 [Puniceicoccales bacterium]|jgi:hypothetical protein|nr:hypothetical protein [Puniceicoccales bacterium]